MKKIRASMKIAFGALLINKLRSALTMLGIIIGVAAVIAMVAVGAGAQVRIQQQIAVYRQQHHYRFVRQHNQLRNAHGHGQRADAHRRRRQGFG